MQAGIAKLHEIPGGYAGTRATIERMRLKVDEAKKNPEVISLASDIVQSVRERDHRGELEAIVRWVKQNVRYVNDPQGVELIQSPLYTIKRGAGDCDDYSILINSLAAALGYNTAFKTIKADPNYPYEFSHVYSLINIDGKWIPADGSQRHKEVGWDPPSHWGYQIWGYSNGILRKNEMSGLGRIGMNKPVNLVASVVEFLNREMTGAARKVKKVITEAPRDQYENADAFFNPERGFFYGGTPNPGRIDMQKLQKIHSPAKPTINMQTVPRRRATNYEQGRSLDKKFAGRQRTVDYPPNEFAIKDGTPPGSAFDGGATEEEF